MAMNSRKSIAGEEGRQANGPAPSKRRPGKGMNQPCKGGANSGNKARFTKAGKEGPIIGSNRKVNKKRQALPGERCLRFWRRVQTRLCSFGQMAAIRQGPGPYASDRINITELDGGLSTRKKPRS